MSVGQVQGTVGMVDMVDMVGHKLQQINPRSLVWCWEEKGIKAASKRQHE